MADAALQGQRDQAGRGPSDAGGPADRALFHHPVEAFKRPIPPVPVHAFAAERDAAMASGAPTGMIALDISDRLDLPWPATTPTMLARYLVIRAGDTLDHTFVGAGAALYVIRGSGETACGEDRVNWATGDTMVLPGGGRVVHSSSADAVLLIVTDEPMARYEQSRFAGEAEVWPLRATHWPRDMVMAELDAMRTNDDMAQAAGRAVVLMTEDMAHRKCVTRNLSLGFNTLPPGGDQRPHMHSAAALTLGIDADGVHSMVAGEQVDWAHGLVALTPPGAVHSHHNRGPREMLSFVVQDSPLHAQLRTSHFSYVD